MSHQTKEQIIDFYKQRRIERPLCITFTTKQKIQYRTPFGSITETISKTELRRTFRHFMNRLNQTYFGNSYRRFNKRLKVFNVEEYSGDERLHLHTILQIPNNVSLSDFKNKVWELWFLKSKWGYYEVRFEEPKEDYQYGNQSKEVGWLNYSIKKIPKEETFITKSSSVDWENTYI